jgi:hypothetical protein
MLETFVRAVQRDFPPEEQEKLAAHEAAVAGTTDREDARRARHCALWAIRLADDKAAAHPRWAELRELHQVWKDVWFGIEFGRSKAAGPGPNHPLKDVEIEWVVDAVAVAQLIGEEHGWAHSPWEDLLVELIGMEPAT